MTSTTDQTTASASELSRYTVTNGASTSHAFGIRPNGLPVRSSHCGSYRFYTVLTWEGDPIPDLRKPLRRLCGRCARMVATLGEALVPWSPEWETTLDREWKAEDDRRFASTAHAARVSSPTSRADEVARHVAAIAELERNFNESWDRHTVAQAYLDSISDESLRSKVWWANLHREHAERQSGKLVELEAALPGITRQIRMRVRVEELGDISSDDQFERWLEMGAER